METNTEREYSKAEAAKVAGCNEMTIHRACKAEKLAHRREPLLGGNEKILIKHADLVEWMKGRTKETALQVPAVTREPDREGDSVSPEMLARAILQLTQNQQQIAQTLEGLTNRLQLPGAQQKPARQPVPLTDRLTVTPDQAARLSGIPNARRIIKEAIESNSLPAIKSQRGPHTVYRIMVDDLKEFLRSLRTASAGR